MKRLVILVLAALAAAGCAKFSIAPQQPSPPPGPPKLIWAGTSDGFTIRWTAGDITAAPVAAPTREVLSALGLTIFDFHAISKKQSSDCDFVRVTQLSSVVGPIVSIRDDDTMKCTNGVNGVGRKAVAIDLNHPGVPVSLTEYFAPRELLGLHAVAMHVCQAKLTDLFTRFAFESVAGNEVTVSLTLPGECKHASVSASLPIPAKLRRPLELAAQGKQGFLERDQARVAGGQTTTINYHYRLNGS